MAPRVFGRRGGRFVRRRAVPGQPTLVRWEPPTACSAVAASSGARTSGARRDHRRRQGAPSRQTSSADSSAARVLRFRSLRAALKLHRHLGGRACAWSSRRPPASFLLQGGRGRHLRMGLGGGANAASVDTLSSGIRSTSKKISDNGSDASSLVWRFGRQK